AEGLCFRCPEKYQPGHACNPPQFLLILDNEQPPDTDPLPALEFLDLDNTDPTNNYTPYYLALFVAAFYGLQSPRAVRVTGYIGNQPVTVLVDCGSEFEYHVGAGDWKNKKGNVEGEFVDFEWCVGKEAIAFQELAVADHNGEGCNGCWFEGSRAAMRGWMMLCVLPQSTRTMTG
nr:hypothetical protein [Tanacetum cinerariifolium]